MPELAYTVLIADDEATIRNGLTEAIPWSDYNAQVIGSATNGQDALTMALALKPDLAVMDIKMPLMDGLEVIHQAHEHGLKTRFIILSGYDDFALAQKAIRYGACAYFLKPLKIEEFKDEVARQLREVASLKRIPEDDAALDVLLRSSRVFLLNQLILNELRSQDEIDRRCNMVELSWLQEDYQVLACSAASADAAAFADAQAVLDKALSPLPHEVWLHGGDLLVGIAGGSPQDLAVIRTRLPGAMAELKEKTGCRFYIGIGKTVTGAENAATAYTSALRALSYHLYELPGDVYDDSMVCRQEPPAALDAVNWDPLLTAMELYDRAAIQTFCRQYLDGLFFVAMPSPDFLRGMCIHLVSSARIQFLSRHADVAPQLPVQTEELRACHSVDSLCMWMTRRLLMLSDRYRQSRDTEAPIIRQAKDFIRDNISANIKARDVAAYVNLSESYFTVYFKQKTGENFRDYLLTQRVDLARSLLAEGRLSVGEIAAATGYQDYRSFSRAFKNITGYAPSEYHTP